MNEQDATEWDDLRAQLETMVVARDGWKRRCYEAETERDQLRADLAAMTERAEKAERERNEARHLLLRRVEASRLDEALSERDTARAELQAAKNLIEIARELLQHVRGGMWEKTLAVFDARQKTTGGSGETTVEASPPDPASLSQPGVVQAAVREALEAVEQVVGDWADESMVHSEHKARVRLRELFSKRLGKGGG